MKAYFAFLILVSLLISSCKKNNPTDANGNEIVRGAIRFEISAVHHTWPVGGIDIYLKKNATDWPGPDSTLYNLHLKADASGSAVFENLFPGNYFIYAKGFDSTFGLEVTGIHAIVLNSITAADNYAYFKLYVSE